MIFKITFSQRKAKNTNKENPEFFPSIHMNKNECYSQLLDIS